MDERTFSCWVCKPRYPLAEMSLRGGRSAGICHGCVRQRSTERRRVAQRHVLRLLRDRCCVDCREARVVLLEFDHVLDKQVGVADLVARGAPRRRIDEEVAKCVVRCVACHRKRTSDDRRDWRHTMLLKHGELVADPDHPLVLEWLAGPRRRSVETRSCRVCAVALVAVLRIPGKNICRSCQAQYLVERKRAIEQGQWRHRAARHWVSAKPRALHAARSRRSRDSARPTTPKPVSEACARLVLRRERHVGGSRTPRVGS